MNAAMFHDSAICGQPVLIHRKFEQRATELVRIAEIRGLSARVVGPPYQRPSSRELSAAMRDLTPELDRIMMAFLVAAILFAIGCYAWFVFNRANLFCCGRSRDCSP